MNDTSLTLKCLGASQNHFCSDFSTCDDDECRLVLGLGPASASYYYSSGFTREFVSSGDSALQLGLSSVSIIDNFNGLDCSMSSYTEITTTPRVVVDEGSTSAKRSGGYIPSLLLYPTAENVRTSVHSQVSLEPSRDTGFSVQQRTSNTKKCKFMGCVKGARGASGLCISHGGGQRCLKHVLKVSTQTDLNFNLFVRCLSV
ncbi:unnamed protein product [Cochlearia groenlandica]